MRGIFSLLLLFTLTLVSLSAQAGPPTKAQRGELRKLIKSGNITQDALEDFLEQNRSYVVNVNYSLSVEEMVEAANYHYSTDLITSKNFPQKKGKVQKVKLRLLHLGHKLMTKREVMDGLDRKGFRPATLPELLALCAEYPKLRGGYNILALGSTWSELSGVVNIPFALRHNGSGNLFLYLYRSDKPHEKMNDIYDRFLVVRK